MWHHTFGPELVVRCKTGRRLQRLEKLHTMLLELENFVAETRRFATQT